MSETSKAHKKQAPKHLRFAIVTVSTSRYEQSKAGKHTTDESGDLIAEAIRKRGYVVDSRQLVSDNKVMIKRVLKELLQAPTVNAIVFTGGTGVNPADVTIETVEPHIEKKLPGFGEIFRRLSFDEIGSAAVMTRAMAGVSKGKAVFCLPGSPQAVKMCLERLILPETAHIILHARGR